MTARSDMERFLRERLETLENDMMWRCNVAGLGEERWQQIMAIEYLHAAVRIAALLSDPRDDGRLAEAIFHLIKKERHKEQQAIE